MEGGEIYRELDLVLPRTDAMDLERIIDGGALPELCGYFEVLYNAEADSVSAPDPDSTRLRLYFPSDDATAPAQIEILLAMIGCESFTIEERNVQEKEYLEAYKEHYRSFPISERVVIVPSWEKSEENHARLLGEGKIPLYLDPGLAFGTGLHPTTALCMEYLDRSVREGMRVIDAGCGSGILSIGATLLGAKEAFAFDVDGNARIAMEHNLQMNPDVADRIRFVRGGFDLPEFDQFEADLLMANITAATILTNREAIDKGRYPVMMLSGILSEKREEVLQAFASSWRLIDHSERDGWVLLVLRRG